LDVEAAVPFTPLRRARSGERIRAALLRRHRALGGRDTKPEVEPIYIN